MAHVARFVNMYNEKIDNSNTDAEVKSTLPEETSNLEVVENLNPSTSTSKEFQLGQLFERLKVTGKLPMKLTAPEFKELLNVVDSERKYDDKYDLPENISNSVDDHNVKGIIQDKKITPDSKNECPQNHLKKLESSINSEKYLNFPHRPSELYSELRIIETKIQKIEYILARKYSYYEFNEESNVEVEALRFHLGALRNHYKSLLDFISALEDRLGTSKFAPRLKRAGSKTRGDAAYDAIYDAIYDMTFHRNPSSSNSSTQQQQQHGNDTTRRRIMRSSENFSSSYPTYNIDGSGGRSSSRKYFNNFFS